MIYKNSSFVDDTDLESDAIIECDNGAWIAVEVKLSPQSKTIDQAARSLLRLRSKIAPERRDDLAARGLYITGSIGYQCCRE